MRGLTLTIAFLALAGAVSAQEVDPRASYFHEICLRPATFEERREAAVTAGWSEVSVVESGLEGVSDNANQPGSNKRAWTFVKETPAGLLRLIISRNVSDSGSISGCGLYDFSAVDPMAPDALGAWVTQPPQTRETEHSISHNWRPPSDLPNVLMMSIAFVKFGSPMGEIFGIRGAALTLSASN